MATTLTPKFTASATHSYVNDLDLSDVTDALTQTWGVSWTNGTGADQADLVWHDTRTLAATSETLDLAGGLTNPLTGATMTFAKIKGLWIRNKQTTTAQNLIIGNATNPVLLFTSAAHTLTLGPKGVFIWFEGIDGKTVTAGTGDGLKLDAGANNVTYDIIIYGTSA